jgi:glycosyltransferase involved in cell wall biosynthesis
VISVVTPAHNEASVISRLLTTLLADVHPDEFHVLVVANGCSDETARIAAAFGPRVSVVSTPIASKSHALQLGDARARGFPRLYVDADVELRTEDARALARALDEPGVLAVAPRRIHVLDGRPLAVRWYYDIWQRLPVVQDGLFGRGVFGVDEGGHRRLAAMPQAISDDLIASVAFAPSERRVVVDAQVVVHTPRTVRDLIRTRVRALTGTVQLQRQLPEAVAGARTTRGDLLAIVRRRPAMAARMLVFLAITGLVRLKARRAIRAGDFTTWLRDDSSRTAVIPTQRQDSADVAVEENR